MRKYISILQLIGWFLILLSFMGNAIPRGVAVIIATIMVVVSVISLVNDFTQE